MKGDVLPQDYFFNRMCSVVEEMKVVLNKILKQMRNTVYDPNWTNVFLQIAPKRCFHDTEIGCISLVWAGAKKYEFSFLLCAGPLKPKNLGFSTRVAGKYDGR